MRKVTKLAALLLLLAPAAAMSAPHGGFDVDTATRAYLDLLKGPARAKSDAYFEGGYWLLLWGALVGIAVELVVLASGWSARFRDWAERVGGRRWWTPALYGAPYVATTALIGLPWTIYTGFVRERQYGLMNQSFAAWFGEQATGLAISLVIVPILLVVLFAVIRRFPRSWWVWGAGVMLGFAAVGALIAPVFIAPLFNTYTEMPAGPMRNRILAMAHANHVPADHVYVVDASKQSKRISANVSGIGPTIRISLNDNLLNRTGPDEVAAVMGHELGHYVLNHVWWLLAEFALVFLAIFGAIYWAAPRMIARWGPLWGVRGVTDPAATPVFAILAMIGSLVLVPVQNTIIRVNEAQADAFGLEAAREPDGFAKVAMRLSEYRKIQPGPVEEFLFFDHPSGATRVHRSMEWKQAHVADPQIVRPTLDLGK